MVSAQHSEGAAQEGERTGERSAGTGAGGEGGVGGVGGVEGRHHRTFYANVR